MINRKNLGHLPKNVKAPGYDPGKLRHGIAHFGVGNFFRAHLAWYVDRYMAESQNLDWGIIGVGLSAGEKGTRKAATLRKQDCLYTLTEAPPEGQASCRVIASLMNYLHATEASEEVLDALASKDTRIVTMTITEGGYFIDENSGEFRLDAEEISKDLSNPKHPSTFFGYVTEGLARRREAGLNGFTILSCDNLRHNGDVTKKAVLTYARARDAKLADWIEKHVTFPNAMVDRITPSVDGESVKKLNAASGLDDELPIIAESFSQWVIEDNFVAGRPDFEDVGAQIVEDVAPHESLKLRILNASHVLLAFTGLLKGHTYVHEAVADRALYDLAKRFLNEYVLPDIKAPPGEDAKQYMKTSLKRFSNDAMADQNVRVGGDGASKIQVFWTETMRHRLEKDEPIDILAFGAASWLEALGGEAENGKKYEPFEPSLKPDDWKKIKSEDLSKAGSLRAFDGWRNAGDDEFQKKLVYYRKLIREKGFRDTLTLL